MYASAAFHWAILFLNVMGYHELVQAYAEQINCQCSSGWFCLYGNPYRPGRACSVIDYGLSGSVHGLTLCAPTVTLTINVCDFLLCAMLVCAHDHGSRLFSVTV